MTEWGRTGVWGEGDRFFLLAFTKRQCLLHFTTEVTCIICLVLILFFSTVDKHITPYCIFFFFLNSVCNFLPFFCKVSVAQKVNIRSDRFGKGQTDTKTEL